MPNRDPKFDLTEQERDQLFFIMKGTTPETRIILAEQLRMMFGLDHVRKANELKVKMAERRERERHAGNSKVSLNPPPPSDR